MTLTKIETDSFKVNISPLDLAAPLQQFIDELTGLVAITALVRPSKSVLDLKPKSVKKKWKDKRFAAGVDRSIIERGAEMLRVQVSDLIIDRIMGMQDVVEQIGPKGNAVE